MKHHKRTVRELRKIGIEVLVGCDLRVAVRDRPLSRGDPEGGLVVNANADCEGDLGHGFLARRLATWDGDSVNHRPACLAVDDVP